MLPVEAKALKESFNTYTYQEKATTSAAIRRKSIVDLPNVTRLP